MRICRRYIKEPYPFYSINVSSDHPLMFQKESDWWNIPEETNLITNINNVHNNWWNDKRYKWAIWQ